MEHLSREELEERLREREEELKEFQITSREFEAELEADIQRSEKNVKDLTASKARLEEELSNVQARLDDVQTTTYKQITELENALSQTLAQRDNLQKYVRELEQTNDDLERANRITMTTLSEYEHQLNLKIEEKAILESELDEKAALQAINQRLRDDARDLQHEILARKQRSNSSNAGDSMSIDIGDDVSCTSPFDALISRSPHAATTLNSDVSYSTCVEASPRSALSNHVFTSSPVTTAAATPPNRHSFFAPSDKRLSSAPPPVASVPPTPTGGNASLASGGSSQTTGGGGGAALQAAQQATATAQTPGFSYASRVSALNVISDLLRKVGTLECKMNACTAVRSSDGKQRYFARTPNKQRRITPPPASSASMLSNSVSTPTSARRPPSVPTVDIPRVVL